MTSSLIINNYANAALNVAKKSNLVDCFVIDLEKFLQNLPAGSVKELSNPALPKKALVKIIEEIANKLSINQLVISFLIVIAKSGRIKFLNSITQSLKSLVKIDKNILEIELISAFELNEELISKIKLILERKYRGKIIEFKNKIKPEILGGLVVKINSLVIDASLKNQLANIANDCVSLINKS